MSRLGLPLLTLLLTLVLSCPSAVASRPPSGARYLLPLREEIGLAAQEGTLQVSGDRRWLVSDGLPRFSPVYDGISSSYVETLLSCRSTGEVFDAYFYLAPPPHGRVAIDSRGRFGALAHADSSGTPDKAWIRVRGQFLSGGRAIVSIVSGRYQPVNATSCAVPHRRFQFRLRPLPRYPGCRHAPGHTVTRSSRGRVYTNWGIDEVGRSRYAYACLYGGRQIVLGRALTSDDYGTLDVFKLAGPFLLYFETVHVEFAPNAESLTVVDLRSFGSVSRTIDYAVPDPAQESYAASFQQFVLTPLGSVAWTASYCQSVNACSNDSVANHDVWISDASGTRRVDTGQQIDPRSLALMGSKVTWVNGGAVHDAPIDAS